MVCAVAGPCKADLQRSVGIRTFATGVTGLLRHYIQTRNCEKLTWALQGRYDRVHSGASCSPSRLKALVALLRPGGILVTTLSRSPDGVLQEVSSSTCHRVFVCKACLPGSGALRVTRVAA